MNIQNFQEFFPNDYIHLLLAAFSAEETGTKGGQCPLKISDDVKFKQETDIYKFMKQEKEIDMNEHLEFWKISEIFDDAESGYLGLLLENKEKRQLVLSHRSTNFQLSFCSNLFKQSGVQCDIMSVVIGVFSTHQAQAYEATQQAVQKARDLKYSLSFCGHSLGAWLAELSVYYCHQLINPPFPNVKAVTFDGPGSFEMMQQMDQQTIKGQSQLFYPEQFDIVFYLSTPNMVNCMNSHIGIGYRLNQENFASIQLPRFINRVTGAFQTVVGALEATIGHELKFIIPIFDSKTGKPKLEHYSRIIKWPSIKYKNYSQESKINLDKILLLISPIFSQFFLIKIIMKILVNFANYITSCSVLVGVTEFLRGNINFYQFYNVHEILNKTNQYQPKVKNWEEFDLKIKGGYYMNNPNEYERNTCNSKQIDQIDEHLINIKINTQRIDNSSCKRIFKQILIQISNTYEYKKRGFQSCITIKHQFRDQININILRDQIRMIIRDYQEDFEQFLNENPYFNNKKIACFFNRLFLYDENYVQRKELEQIEKAFSQSNVVVITGPSQFGKTTLAYQYAKKLKDSINAIVLPFNAENISTLYSDLQYYHHHLYQIPNQTFTFEYLQQDLLAKIQNTNQQLIIIFDNVKSLEIIQTLITNLKQLHRIIITTVNNQIFSQTNYELLNISALTEQECLNYINNSIHKRKLNDSQKKMLIQSSNCIPKLLHIYIAQLNNPDNVLEQTEIILKNFNQSNKYSSLIEQIQDDFCIKILKYISWLYPNKIEMHLIQQLLQNTESNQENTIQKGLIKLSKLGFISILGNQCIMIDTVIQEECRRLQQSQEYLLEILKYFYEWLPDIQTEKHTINAQEIAQYYYIHVKEVITLIEQKHLFKYFLNNNFDLFEYATMITLKLSIVYQFLIHDYQSCQKYLDLFGEQYYQAMKTMNSINLQALTIAIINNTQLYLTMNKKQEALTNSVLFQIIETEIFEISPFLKSNMYNQLAILYQQYQQYDLSNQQLEKSKKIKCLNQSEDDLRIQKILMIQAENFLLQKYYNQAINLYQKALQHLQLIENNNTLREVSLIKAQLYYQFGRIYFKLKQDSQETQKCFDVAIKIWQEKLKNIESIEMANFQYNIGLVFKQMKRYDESLKALENADQQKKKIIGEEKNEQFAVISYQKGLIMIEMKKIDQAEQELIKAQNIMQISNNFKLKSKIDLQLALINEQKGLKFEFIKALEELISKKRNHYAYIHPSINNDILSLADAYEKMFKDTAKQTELYQLIYFITILHESQIQCYQQKNPITDQIEQAKFQANYKQINANWLRKNNSLTIIKRFQPNFFELDLQRTLILRSGIITKEEFEIKQILQTSTLNYIRQYTFEGKWERSILSGFTLYGVENYINKKHLNNQLRGELNKNQNLKIALMLCFEAINIGIVQSNFEYISFANRFITKIIRYQQMQNFLGDVIQLHPEYFIDGKILKSLVNDNTILQENLGNEEKKISSNKIISDIIFNMC